MTRSTTVKIEAELIGHSKVGIWFRVEVTPHTYRVLTYPADVVAFKPETHPRHTRLLVEVTDSAVEWVDPDGWRFAGDIVSVERIEVAA